MTSECVAVGALQQVSLIVVLFHNYFRVLREKEQTYTHLLFRRKQKDDSDISKLGVLVPPESSF